MLIVFSYCGQAIFTELISSMQKPKDFPKAVWSSTLTMMGSYILIASVGYACLGALAIAPVTDALPEDFWAQIANVLLFGHVLVAYIIELNILTKGMIHAWHTLDPAHWPTGRSKGECLPLPLFLLLSKSSLRLTLLLIPLRPTWRTKRPRSAAG